MAQRQLEAGKWLLREGDTEAARRALEQAALYGIYSNPCAAFLLPRLAQWAVRYCRSGVTDEA